MTPSSPQSSSIEFDIQDAATLRKAAAHLRRKGGDMAPEELDLTGQEAAPGHLSARVVDELVDLRTMARAASERFSEAIKAQAEKHELKAGALRKYICAVEADKLSELDAESDDLARLLTRGEDSDEDSE